MSHGYGYRSDVRLRKENQDTFGVFEFDLFNLLVVCDGMGGHVGGRQASAIAVRTIHDELSQYRRGDLRGALVRAIEQANTAIHEAAHNNYKLMGMGTTVVAAIVHRQTCHVAWVGDSRVYRVGADGIDQITRDHTMVNLFVDAELLSPEDAATHPEAHILSRSLGVERSVEVDLADPITLTDDDRLLLCSDGVHGVLGTKGLAGIDWADPTHGVEDAFSAIASADGDDNATLVVYGGEIAGSGLAATPPPDLAALEEEARAASSKEGVRSGRRATAPTMLPEDDLHEDVSVMEEGTEDEPTAMTEGTREAASTSAMRKRVARQTTKPGLAGTLESMGIEPRVALLGAAGLVVLLLGGAALIASSDGAPPTDATSVAAAPAPVTPAPRPVAAATRAGPLGLADANLSADIAASPVPGSLPVVFSPTSPLRHTRPALDGSMSWSLPPAEVYLDSTDDPTFTPPFFIAEFPPAPRRAPVSGSRFDRRPPGGPIQVAAAQAVRGNRCREALDTVATAVKQSMDYAALYNSAWFCFNDSNQAVMLRSRAETFEDLVVLLAHLEGRRANILEPLAADDTDMLETVASAGDTDAGSDDAWAWTWDQPAMGGLEYRLGRYLDEAPGPNTPSLAEVVVDLQGDGRVADDLAIDLLLELTIAASIARQSEITPEMRNVWARRVYVAARLLDGPIGDLIERWQTDAVGELIGQLYREATEGDLPEPVATALAIARTGGADAPPIAVDPITTLASSELSEEMVTGGGPPTAGPGATARAETPDPAPRRRASSSSRRRSSRRASQPDDNGRTVLKVWYPHRPEPVLLDGSRGRPSAPPSDDE